MLFAPLPARPACAMVRPGRRRSGPIPAAVPGRVLLLALMLSAAASRSLASSLPAEDPADGKIIAQFQALIEARFAAFGRADATTYAALIAPEAVYITDDGARVTAKEMIAAVAQRLPGEGRYDISHVQVSRIGEMALVNFDYVEHVQYGPRDRPLEVRSQDVYVRRSGRWLVLRHAEAQAWVLPPPVDVGAATLQAYAGTYEWWPGYVDRETVEGGQLFSQPTGADTKTRNVPAAPDSFHLDGDANLLTFYRDGRGRVRGYVLHWTNGSVTVARRVD